MKSSHHPFQVTDVLPHQSLEEASTSITLRQLTGRAEGAVDHLRIPPARFFNWVRREPRHLGDPPRSPRLRDQLNQF